MLGAVACFESASDLSSRFDEKGIVLIYQVRASARALAYDVTSFCGSVLNPDLAVQDKVCQLQFCCGSNVYSVVAVEVFERYCCIDCRSKRGNQKGRKTYAQKHVAVSFSKKCIHFREQVSSKILSFLMIMQEESGIKERLPHSRCSGVQYRNFYD